MLWFASHADAKLLTPVNSGGCGGLKQDRIILADDHPIFRDGLRRLIQRFAPESIIEEAGSYEELLSLARSAEAPTTIIADLIFAGENIEPMLDALRQEFERTSIIVVSMIEDNETAERIMARGMNGFISKSVPPRALALAIASVRDGEAIVQLEPPIVCRRSSCITMSC